jgi:tRNA A-37 threonylcarbamoyl transferase component Bud32
MSEDLTYTEALLNIERVIAQGRSFKADVFISRADGQKFVVKDFGKRGFWERNFVGRLVIGREIRAYTALAGVDGLPSRYKKLSPFSLAIEYLEGKDLGGIERGEIGPGVLRQFEQIIEDLHERGWVHLDLQKRSNVLLVNGKVFVVDLASAVHTGSVPLVGRCLTGLLGFADRISLVKMKSIYAPELMTEKEQKWLRLRNLVMPTKW